MEKYLLGFCWVEVFDVYLQNISVSVFRGIPVLS